MDPYILLKIENHVPNLYYFRNAEDEGKKLTENDENMSDLFLDVGSQLNLREDDMEDSAALNHLLNLASASDEGFLENSPQIDTNNLEFELESIILGLLDEAKELKSEYESEEINEELANELDRNRKMDILASLYDTAYKILIAKTLLAAYELEIKDIKLQTDSNYPRFIEKMSNELEHLGLDFSLITSDS